MNLEEKPPEISYEVRVKPGLAGTDIYDNLTLAEANQIAGMWRRKKEEAETTE
jgi:hypothetical protein